MGIIVNKILIKVNRSTYKYYESLGYKIPKKIDSKHNFVADESKYITINIKDLKIHSKIKVPIKCDCCGKIYEIKYSDYTKCNHDGKIYCNFCAKKLFNSGENCYMYGKGYLKIGNNNPNWNPSITDEERERNRHTFENSQFIKKIMARDNYTCQCCGNKLNHDGVVHHLNSWNNFKEQRYDETNGITLCKNCHKNFHSIYGYGNNTKEQFEEWIKQAVELVKYEGELPTARQIYCIEEDKIYNSAKQLSYEWNLKSDSAVYDACNKKIKTLKSKHILWNKDYINMNKYEIYKYLKENKSTRRRKVICLTTGQVFDSIKEAGLYFNIKNYSSISYCCKGKYSYSGRSNDNIPLKWMYYEDYIKENEL